MDVTILREILRNLQQQRTALDQQIAAVQAELEGAESPAARAKTVPLRLVDERSSSRKAPKPTAVNKGGRPVKHSKCTVDGCTNPHVAKGLCNKHYAQAKRRQGRKS